MAGSTSLSHIPLIYRLFFLYIEPIASLVGSYYAAGLPGIYLFLLSPTHPSFSQFTGTTTAAPPTPDTPTLISLYQLSNLYVLFALNEHFVLSSTSSLKTWKRLIAGLFLADLGHLWTMYPLAQSLGAASQLTGGSEMDGLCRVYLHFWEWNSMEWGSVGFVYFGALMRIAFLLGVGLKQQTGKEVKEE